MDTTATGQEFREDRRRQAAPLPGSTVRALSAINPWRAAWSIAEPVGVILVAIAFAVTYWQIWVIVPVVVLIASRQQALFVLVHDAAHYRMFKARWLNDLAGRLLAMPVGISMCTYRVVHRLHHNHLFERRDPDMALIAGYPRGKRYLFGKLVKDMAGLTAWKTYKYFFGAPVINDDAAAANRPLDDTAPALRRAARHDRWWVVAWHLAALAAAIASGYWVEYLVLWVLPLVTVLQAILRLRAILEHGAVTDTGSPLTAARTNLGPAWLMWFLFPHHVNYHIEHHLLPSIPHYNLPRCHAELAAAGALDRAEVRRVGSSLARVLADPAPA